MEKMYTEKFTLRTSDFDCFGKIKPSAILDLFQEVAGAHAIQLGVGFDDLLRKNALWVLVKVKFKVVAEIQMHKNVVVKTWPLPAGRVTLQREYLIEDGEGNPLVLGTSDWVTMNMETRKLSPTTDVYPLKEFCEDRNFEEKLRKIPDFDASDAESCEIVPGFCDIDKNMHVNNIRYSDFVLNLVKPSESDKIKELQIDFHKEIKSDMKIDIYAKKEDKTISAKGVSKDGGKMFCCTFSYE